MSDIDAVIAAFSDKTRVVYFETPANPTMTLVDIAAVSAVARAHDVLTVVDNTYATPLITRPIELGADVVVHSATKYLGGHGDLVAGIAVGSAEVMERVRLYGLKDMTGAALSPFNAMLILRGLKTLALRMERHSQTGLAVARWLKAHPQVRTVAYPGLEDGPQYALAKAQMRHFGGMIAFELEGGYEAGVLELWQPGAAQAATDCAVISFGDDSSDFARDGQCDDIRFEGIGAAELLIPVNTFRDASDCQRLCRFGVVALRDYR